MHGSLRNAFASLTIVVSMLCVAPAWAQENPHGWLGTETLKTPFGDFAFKNGYPIGDAGQRLLDLQKFNRAVEIYTTEIMPVSQIALREGLRADGPSHR
jgi:hypothetical protein